MRFYSGQHRFYCGVDLHTRTLSLCVLDSVGAIALEVTLPPDPDRLLAALAPYRDGLVVGCECLFAWYWLADLCNEQKIPFVLGHALYLKAIHGGKTKTDTIDAQKLARLLRGGTFTEAYVYPKAMRATRDLLRRRTYLVRKRAELLAHLQMTFLQYNLTPPAQKLCYAANRAKLNLNVFADVSTRSMLQADLADYLPEGTNPADVRISPLRAFNLAGLPVAIIHTAEYDPMRDEGNAYARRLLAAGVSVEHVCHDGMIHNFHAMTAVLPQANLIISQIGEQIRRAVA